MAVVRPRQGARLAGVAGHAHVARVGDPPAVQRVLLHRGDEEAPVGRSGDVEMRALPFEQGRLGGGVGEPQRRAIVMGERQPIALGQEGEAAHRGRRGPGFHRAGGVAGARLLARRPGDRAGLRGQRIDPAPLFVGDRLDAAVGGDPDDAAVVAAGQQRCRRRGRRRGSRPQGERRRGARRRGSPITTTPSASAKAGSPPMKAAATAGAPAASGRKWAVSDEFGSAMRRRSAPRDQAAQARKPSRIAASSRSRPMNTTFDSRFSPGFQSRCGSPSSIMCTPWKTKRLGSSLNATMPLQRRMSGRAPG